MNKLFTKIVGAALGLTMAIGVGVAVGSNVKEATPVHSASATWNKITSNPVSGTEYLILSSDGTKYFDASVATIDSTSNPVAITVLNNSVTGDYDGKAWTFTKSGDDWYISRTLNNTTTYIGRTANSNGITTGSSGIANTITNSSGNFTIKGTESGSSKQMSYNSQSGRFRYFGSGTVQLYQKAASKTVSSISVKTAPTKTTYYAGEYFNPIGLVITATYSDSTTADISYSEHSSDFTFSPTTSTALTTSNKSVTITYATKTASQAITVNEARTLSSISISGYTTTFDQGDAFEFGGTVTAYYSSGDPANVTSSATFSGYDMSTSGSQTVTVSYTENGVTKTATYTITVNKVLSVTFTAGTDTGSTSVTKGGITVSMSTMSRDDNYRCYANTAITIESSNGNIDSIVFSFTDSSYDGGFNSSYLSVGSDSWTSGNANGQARITKIVVTLENSNPSVSLAPSSADSVTLLRGNSDTSVKVLVKNIETPAWTFTYDEGGNTGLSTSANISVSASALDANDVSTLTISTKQTGSTGTTTLHISVSDGNDDYDVETAIPVTINQKPASMTVVHSDIVAGHLEIQTGTYKQVSFSGLDTDGNPYSIAAGDVTPSVQSGNSYVEPSGSRITAIAEGTAVVRYTLKALTSVFAEVTVDVVDDYKTTVNSITFNSNLTATQGDPVDSSDVFATKVANTHFLSTETITDSELLFSYENNRSGAVGIGVFSYDFSHGTTVDSTHKSQAVYVFTSFDESYSDSFTITVEQKNDPLTAITFTNVTNNAVDVTRGNSFQLEWAYTPTNPTDGKEVEFIINDNSDGIDITVSKLGLISIGASSDLGDALVIIQSTHDDSIQDYVVVSAVLGTMKYTVSEAESWTKVTDDSTLSAGDVIMVASDAKGKVLGEFAGSNKYANEGEAKFSDGSASDVTGALEFTLETGSSSGTWKLKNGTKYLYGTDTKVTLCLNDTATDVTITISSGNATIDFGSGCRILHNVGSTRFSNYTSGTSSTMLLPQIYLKSGGDVEMDVTETLFNGVHNNFGAGKTYEWSETCSSFNSGNWLSACNALKGITGYSSYKLELAVADMNGNEIEVFLAKYDAIVNKFGTAYDHLGRFDEGGINHGARSINPLQIVKDSGNIIAIVVATVVSMAAIGGYFFLRKRKEY